MEKTKIKGINRPNLNPLVVAGFDPFLADAQRVRVTGLDHLATYGTNLLREKLANEASKPVRIELRAAFDAAFVWLIAQDSDFWRVNAPAAKAPRKLFKLAHDNSETVRAHNAAAKALFSGLDV
jgi:hypothetical protein